MCDTATRFDPLRALHLSLRPQTSYELLLANARWLVWITSCRSFHGPTQRCPNLQRCDAMRFRRHRHLLLLTPLHPRHHRPHRHRRRRPRRYRHRHLHRRQCQNHHRTPLHRHPRILRSRRPHHRRLHCTHRHPHLERWPSSCSAMPQACSLALVRWCSSWGLRTENSGWPFLAARLPRPRGAASIAPAGVRTQSEHPNQRRDQRASAKGTSGCVWTMKISTAAMRETCKSKRRMRGKAGVESQSSEW